MRRHRFLFVNLPVADLDRSRTFFSRLGYAFQEDFCDEDGLCLQLGSTLFAMLLREELFDTFHDGVSADPGSVETLLCLTADSREEVDAVVDSAVLAGGAEVRAMDHGFMYGRSFSDPDGHVWEIMWADSLALGGGRGPGAGDRLDLGCRREDERWKTSRS